MAFSKVILNGTTLIDLTQDTATDAYVASPKTYHKADGTQGTGTASGSNDFIVTVSWDSSTSKWTPDKTFAQINEAYTAGKTIAVRTNVPVDQAVADGEYIYDGGYYDDWFGYNVIEYDNTGGVEKEKVHIYTLIATGLRYDGTATYIFPDGTINITQSGNTDVTNYDTANVPAGSATAPATISGTSATVSTGNNTLTLSKTVSVTPTVSAGYVSSGTAGNSSVSLTANVTTQAAQTIHPSTSDQTIASGTYLTGTQTISGDANLVAGNIKSGTTIFGVTGNYSGGGGTSKNAQAVTSTTRVTSTSLTACSGTITVAKTGTYDVYWSTHRTSTSGSWSSRLYVNNTASGTEQTSGWSNHVQPVHLTNVSLTAGQTIRVYAKSRGSNYYAYVPLLTIIET